MSSLPPTVFIRALSILRRTRMVAFGLKGEAAAKFYALVRIGTPVNIADTQPEDATIGPKVQRVDDSRTPDPPPLVMISEAAFEKPSGPLLE